MFILRTKTTFSLLFAQSHSRWNTVYLCAKFRQKQNTKNASIGDAQ